MTLINNCIINIISYIIRVDSRCTYKQTIYSVMLNLIKKNPIKFLLKNFLPFYYKAVNFINIVNSYCLKLSTMNLKSIYW